MNPPKIIKKDDNNKVFQQFSNLLEETRNKGKSVPNNICPIQNK